MATTSGTPAKGSKIKDLVVTAAVASVVSALVLPFMQRWLYPITGAGPGGKPPDPDAPPVDEYQARLERLLEVPDPFTPAPRTTWGPRTSRRDESHDDDDDLQP